MKNSRKKIKATAFPCPTRELLDRVGDKWSVLLIITLRHLERDGFIKRYFYPEIPPRVEYELTPLGDNILSIVQQLKSWVENHWSEIHEARINFDSLKKQ